MVLTSVVSDPEFLDKALEKAEALSVEDHSRSVAFVWYLLWVCGFDSQFKELPADYADHLLSMGWKKLSRSVAPKPGDIYLSKTDRVEDSEVGFVAKLDLRDKNVFTDSSVFRSAGERPRRRNKLGDDQSYPVSNFFRYGPVRC